MSRPWWRARSGGNSVLADMTVVLPEGRSGNVVVERFDVPASVLRRDAPPAGTYTRLMQGRRLWMSDTPDEMRDHMAAANEMRERGGRVLIAGLGLGMVLRAALFSPRVREVDVVEVNPDVIALVGPSYQALATAMHIDLRIHQADIFTLRWPPGTRWNVAWFDVWGDVSTDELAEMTRLRRSYGRRTDWNDCWARQRLLLQRERWRHSPW